MSEPISLAEALAMSTVVIAEKPVAERDLSDHDDSDLMVVCRSCELDIDEYGISVSGTHRFSGSPNYRIRDGRIVDYGYDTEDCGWDSDIDEYQCGHCDATYPTLEELLMVIPREEYDDD